MVSHDEYLGVLRVWFHMTNTLVFKGVVSHDKHLWCFKGMVSHDKHVWCFKGMVSHDEYLGVLRVWFHMTNTLVF